MKMKPLLVVLYFALCFQMSTAQRAMELGDVNWQRDLDKAIELSRSTNKPIFILFQEVPGCLTCRNYGQQVLSHPLIVEAIETLFIPVAIFNNNKGKDAEVLTFFQEPSWNNPVVRIVDKDKRDTADRLNGNYSKAGITDAMINALIEIKKVVPHYLNLLSEEFNAENRSELAYLSMYCFWTGEKEIGKLDGVVETEAGFMNGKEVVRVKYNPCIIGLGDVVSNADATSCAQHIFTTSDQQRTSIKNIIGKHHVASATNFRADREPKYYLSQSIYRFIPMTETQASRVNSLIGQKKNPNHLLSAQQLKLLDYFSKNKDQTFEKMINRPLIEAWATVEKYLN